MRKQFFLPLIVAMFLLPLFSHAQESSSLLLSVEPALPGVGDTYTVTSRVQGNNTPKASQTWYVNGSEVSDFANKSSISLTAQETASIVSSRVEFTNGASLEARTTITPVRVDLIVTPHTLTPAFYAGGALPTHGSSFTVTALVFKNGIEQSNLAYAWSIDNAPQQNGAVRNLDRISHTPGFGGDVLVSVEIYDAQNKKIAHESVAVPVVTPEIFFYEHNPLRGLSKIALNEPYQLISEEMVVRGEAYYLSAQSVPEDLHIEWKIDGKSVEPSGEDKQELLIQKGGGSGRSVVSFHIRNLTDLLQGVKKSLTITF